MQVSTQQLGDVAVITVDGAVDAGSVNQLRTELDSLVGSGQQRFVIDLSKVPFMDSCGLATLVQTFKRVRIGSGDVRVAGLQEDVLRIFQLVRLDRVFDLFPAAPEAVASFGTQHGAG